MTLPKLKQTKTISFFNLFYNNKRCMVIIYNFCFATQDFLCIYKVISYLTCLDIQYVKSVLYSSIHSKKKIYVKADMCDVREVGNEMV
jgi:hypothetical protein